MKLLLSISITFSFILLCSSNAFAKCTEEQISKMIVNNISQEQIDKTCSANSSGEAIAEVTKTDLNNESGEVISISDWRSKEPNGLGFGLSSSGLAGINLFYDKNLDEFSQIHFQISSLAAETESIFGITKLRVTEVLFLCSYRRFFSQEKGFYYGFGGGYGANTLTYTDTSSNYEYAAKGSGMIGMGEIGWQGNDGYYFHIGYQPAIYIAYSDDYDVAKIPDISNTRSVADEGWEYSKNPTQLSIGFGWFF